MARLVVRFLLVGVSLSFGIAGPLNAQSVTATLVGTVTDQSGAAVPSACVGEAFP